MTQNPHIDCSLVRADFPFLKPSPSQPPLVYLDSAATAQKPRAVIDAMSHFYEHEYATVHRGVYSLCRQATAKYQRTREQVRAFLNAPKVEEIIFTKGTTESINLIAHSFGKAFIHQGDEILVSAMEHHSNLVPWQLACQERGAHLKIIPMNPSGELLMEDYARLLTPRTRLVAVAHIANSIGTVNPIAEIVQLAHRAGAKVLVDGAQSAPHFKLDLKSLDVDFFVFSGHKLYGPTGIGVLYGKESLLDQMPPYHGGGDMVELVEYASSTYQPLPLKFEAGTPMIAQVIGLGAAIEYLNHIGIEAIEKHEQNLVRYAQNKLQNIPGLHFIGQAKEKGALIGFVVEGVHPLDLAALLDLKQIAIRTGHLCAQPVMRHFQVSGIARISFALYNTTAEIDYLCDALCEIIPLLKR